jgi:hypothetical protein
MTPKEKAIELVNMFRKYVNDGRDRGYYSSQMTFSNQKQCALIAVDEIINVLSKDTNPLVNYWFDVKREIELL